MKKIFLYILISCNFIQPLSSSANILKTNTVSIIPINGPIESALVYIIRRGIDDAVRNNSSAIIFEMNTPGGSVDAAGEIIKLISTTEIPTYTFINNGAYSAGAFIALASGNIYMVPGSVIGAATPMMMSPMGGVQEMPDDVKEKMTSAVAAMVRAAAEQGGFDPKLAECMVRAELEYKVGRKIISEKGKLLTLTNTEAEVKTKDNKPLLSSATVDNLDDLIQFIGLENVEKRVIKATGSEKLARMIAQIAPILMLIGMGSLWMEFKTPGIGIFGILGASCLLLFFLGHHIAGLSGMEDLALFLIGITLIGLEIFIIPGFGLLGISGFILILFSFINAMTERLPGSWTPISFEPETFTKPLINTFIALAGSLILIVFIGKFFPKSRFFNQLTLSETISNNSDKKNHAEVVIESTNKKNAIGDIGITYSDLRPSGSAIFNNKKIDVFTQGEFIPKNKSVEIISIKGNRLIVQLK